MKPWLSAERRIQWESTKATHNSVRTDDCKTSLLLKLGRRLELELLWYHVAQGWLQTGNHESLEGWVTGMHYYPGLTCTEGGSVVDINPYIRDHLTNTFHKI